MGNPLSEATSKTILIFGDFSLESVEDKIIAIGNTFVKSSISKILDWMKMGKDLKQLSISGELLAILLFLTENELLKFSPLDFLEYWHALFFEMKKFSSLIFIEEESFQDNIIHSHEDEMINKCLQFININLELFKNISSNNDFGNFVRIRSKMLSNDLSIDILDDRIKLNYKMNKGEGMSMARRSEIDPLTENLFHRAKHILLEIEVVRTEIKQMATSFNEIAFISLLTSKIKKIEPLFEQIQRDFVEKQTEQTQRVKQLLKFLQESKVEIIPYRNRKEISLRVHYFLDGIDKGVFFHLYVPNGRYQEDQLASFFRLFESYMQRVENLQFVIETRRTLHAQIYEFKSKNMIINSSEMEVGFSRFESFMSLCQNDQKQAEALLLRAGVNPSEASRLMTKYFKEYQRLLLDIEHERERKMLDLRQKLESEAFELTNDTSLVVSKSVQPTALLSLPHNLDPFSIAISNSSVVINPGIQSYIEQAIYGDIHYTTEDKELLHFFDRYAERLEAIRLRSDLEQFKDPSSSEVERKTAKQKIAGFLSKVAPAIGQSALTVLTAYLEKILTGS